MLIDLIQLYELNVLMMMLLEFAIHQSKYSISNFYYFRKNENLLVFLNLPLVVLHLIYELLLNVKDV